jgi:transposase
MIEMLFPSEASLCIHQIEVANEQLDIFAQSGESKAICPHCYQVSHKVHSQYQRHPHDLPCLGYRVQMHLTVRRFFCHNSLCQHVTFAESFPGFLNYKARRTQRLKKQQLAVAFSAGGEEGRRLLEALRMPLSGDLLIREIRLTPEEGLETPRVLGIDDWAKLKGQTYGTILVDLESSRPIDLLDSRETEAVAAWLKAHPGVEIIGRDRSLEYAKAVKEGAPEAQQVADRWHLLKNLREAIENLLIHKPAALQAVAYEGPDEKAVETVNSGSETTKTAETENKTSGEEASITPVHHLLTKAERDKIARQARRKSRYERVRQLHQAGYSMRAIAMQVKLSRRTVKKYITTDECPQYTRERVRPSILTPYLPYLEIQWQAGFTNATQLWREICSQGFSGSRSLVSRWAAAERKHLPRSTRYSRKQPDGVKIPIRRMNEPPPWSVSRTSWLLVKDREQMDEKERAALAQIKAADSQIAIAAALAERFVSMVKQREGRNLKQWLLDVTHSGIQALMSFANGIRSDLQAVRNALSMIWSNGPTEGHINRLKLIKRKMYGRANFDLLRKRVLYRPEIS